MANYQLLKADIDAKVYQNGAQEITGANLNSVLNAMVTTLGAEYQFAGVATKDTNPGTPDAKVFYIANGKGTYTNFGGINVTEDEVVVLYWDTAWHKVSTGIASQAKLTELESEVDDISTSLNSFVEKKIFDKKVDPNGMMHIDTELIVEDGCKLFYSMSSVTPLTIIVNYASGDSKRLINTNTPNIAGELYIPSGHITRLTIYALSELSLKICHYLPSSRIEQIDVNEKALFVDKWNLLLDKDISNNTLTFPVNVELGKKIKNNEY